MQEHELRDAIRRAVEALQPSIDAGVATHLTIRVAATADELAAAFPAEAERVRHVYAGGLADGEVDEAHAIDSAVVRLGRCEVLPAQIKRRPLEPDERLALSRQQPALPCLSLPWERA